MFRLDMLPGADGDCLLLSYGDDARPRHVLIDCGRKSTYRSAKARLRDLPTEERTFELLIVTHIDADHVAGVVPLLEDDSPVIAFKDVWFNGYHHLHDSEIETFGPVQGEQISEALRRPGRRVGLAWNAAFDGHSVEIARVKDAIDLEGGLAIRFLSPDRTKLEALIDTWDIECKAAGLVKGVNGWRPKSEPGLEVFGALNLDTLASTTLDPDDTPANGTSIVVIAEYGEQKVLLAGDAHPDILRASLEPLAKASPGGRVELAGFKLPHHGSRNNLSKEILDLVACRRYLISSYGRRHHHPHKETIARVLQHGRAAGDPHLIFNYRSPEALIWDNDRWRKKFGYTTNYPPSATDGTNGTDLT
jgi:hypothetical protein